MSLRLAPPASHPTSTSTTKSTTTTSSSTQGAPSAPGLFDTLRSSSPSTTSPLTPTSTHPLEARLTAWRSTQDTLKLSLLRRTYGIAEPVRRGMELKIVQAGDWRPSQLGKPAGVHEDILAGRDAEIGWEDVYSREESVVGGEETGGGVHGEMEKVVGMGKW